MRAGSLTCQIEPLAWDSRHFGFRMGRLTLPAGVSLAEASSSLSAALEEARRQGFEQLMVRTSPVQMEAIHALENAGFHLVDTLLTLELDLRRPHVSSSTPSGVRMARPADVERLMEIAREAFRDKEVWIDRFHADPHIPQEKADALYAQWMKNSVIPPSKSESMADCTWVAQASGAAVGFLTCVRGTATQPGKVSLNAVEKASRGKGIYKSLVLRSLTWFQEQGTAMISVRTSVFSQPVQRTWIQLGAFPKSVEHTFHWWASP